jgi:peptide deformylase
MQKTLFLYAMKNYDIIHVPHPSLKAKSHPVSNVDDAIRAQMDAMLLTMYDAPGIGLAANQVNILNRVLVMDLSRRDEDEPAGPIFMANPEIIYESEEMSVMEEGCLSIPQQTADVTRPAIVRVKYLDYNNKEAVLEATGLLSHCVQHEIDHLDGVLFVDHLSMLKRNMLLRRYDKMKKQNLL